MTRRSRRLLFAATAVIGCVALTVRGASAEPAAEAACSDSYVQTQRSRRAGQLLEAREHAIRCGQDVCSPTVRVDCVRWLAEIERALPSIVIEARGVAASERGATSVWSGNRLLATRLDGRAIVLDPGRHVIRVESRGRVRRLDLLVREGEKLRMVSVEFAPRTRAPDETPTVPSDMPPREPDGRRNAAGYVFASVALVALSVSGLLAVSGLTREKSLRDGCGRTRSCARGEVASVERLYWGADAALGVAALSAAGAVGVWTLGGDPEGPRAASSSGRLRGARMLVIRGRF